MAPVSLAASLGVRPGDYIVAIDGVQASKFTHDLYMREAPTKTYTFFSRTTSEKIDAKCSGIVLGLTVKKTPEAVRGSFDIAGNYHETLEVMWEAGDWANLGRLSKQVIEAETEEPSFMAKVFQRDQPRPNTVALVFLGAAHYEMGRESQGLELIQYFREHYVENWTQNFDGICEYYIGLAALRSGRQEQAVASFQSAFDKSKYDRVADMIESATGTRPPKRTPLWEGRRFPTDYQLPVIGAERYIVGLRASLKEMVPGKLLLTCMLASYRGNGPYNAFMHRYLNYAHYFREYLHTLHIITMEPTRKPGREYYHEAEDIAIQRQLPIRVLLEDGRLTEAVGLRGSPHVFAINRSGKVLHDGALGPVDLWNAVAALSSS